MAADKMPWKDRDYLPPTEEQKYMNYLEQKAHADREMARYRDELRKRGAIIDGDVVTFKPD